MKTINVIRLAKSSGNPDDRQVFSTGRDVLRRVRCLLLLASWAIAVAPASAQIQQAWVVHYNNGITNGTGQGIKMALDAAGNIYVTGSSPNVNSNLGYVTIKYAPNGNQLWAARYDSTNYPSATPSCMAIDSSNSVIVTGSALTVKYDSNGNQLWTAPYAGAALAVDSNASVYVTGYGSHFNTIKLSPTGTNLWQAAYTDVGPTLSQAIIVNNNGDVYVSGSDQWAQGPEDNYVALLVIKYASNGVELWNESGLPGHEPPDDYVEIIGEALDSNGNLYIEVNFPNGAFPDEYSTYKYAPNGTLLWNTYLGDYNSSDLASGMTLDNVGNVLITGDILYGYTVSVQTGYVNYYYDATFKLNPAGSVVWTNDFPIPPSGSSSTTAITVDSSNNVYVTGYSAKTNSLNDIVTIKYGPNGNQEWVERYNGPGNGNDAGNAIAVDNSGNVYVTGYDTLPGGGTEIVTIKYSPLTLQRRADGTVLLQAQGASGENFQVEASTDSRTWSNIFQGAADTNGLFQYDDTNAPQFPYRLYYTIPQ